MHDIQVPYTMHYVIQRLNWLDALLFLQIRKLCRLSAITQTLLSDPARLDTLLKADCRVNLLRCLRVCGSYEKAVTMFQERIRLESATLSPEKESTLRKLIGR